MYPGHKFIDEERFTAPLITFIAARVSKSTCL
jgi:hypothetical protein